MQTQHINDATKSKQPTFKQLNMHQWSAIVKQWDQTKESQQAYCQRLNININTFSYVRSKLNRKPPLENKFIPVTIQPDEPIIEAGHLLIFENKNGIKLQIPLSVKESTLLQVLKLIGWSHA